jgi:hypothetical protein
MIWSKKKKKKKTDWIGLLSGNDEGVLDLLLPPTGPGWHL